MITTCARSFYRECCRLSFEHLPWHRWLLDGHTRWNIQLEDVDGRRIPTASYFVVTALHHEDTFGNGIIGDAAGVTMLTARAQLVVSPLVLWLYFPNLLLTKGDGSEIVQIPHAPPEAVLFIHDGALAVCLATFGTTATTEKSLELHLRYHSTKLSSCIHPRWVANIPYCGPCVIFLQVVC